MSGLVFAVVGAESTGKTTLASGLCLALQAQGLDAVVVPEWLRAFCVEAGRTPRQDEQAGIAAEQSRLIDDAASRHAIVLADTTALMTAVYSDFIFGDASLYPVARQAQAKVTSTLLTSLDLDWVADGLQRDGPHVREPVDQLIRQALHGMGLPFAVVAGQGEARLQHALDLIAHLLDAPERALRTERAPRWRWICERCDDGACEQHWMPPGQ
jgi:nicotinamide riboside kinase